LKNGLKKEENEMAEVEGFGILVGGDITKKQK